MNRSLHSHIKSFSTQLTPLYQNSSYQEQIVWWMLVAITDKSQAQLMSTENVLTQEHFQKLQAWVKEHIEDKKPLQYLIGSVPFGDTTILIEPPILIPRSETEEWVCNLIAQLKNLSNKNITILDLCTGSGAIACALAKAFPEARIFATDISEQALVLAEKNAVMNGINSIEFIKSDLFSALCGKKFDLIVTNPPYLSYKEWQETDPMVRDWEDYQALVAQEDGLKLIKNIIDQAPNYLSNKVALESWGIAQLYVEIGYKQGTLVKQFMQKNFSKVTLMQDYAKNDRVVSGMV